MRDYNHRTNINLGSGCVVYFVGIVGAVCVSWIFNHSVLWCILHGLLNWLYLGYKAVWYVVTHF